MSRQLRKEYRARVIRGGDSIDKLYVFNRDKWECQNCGLGTPIELMGTNNPMAPTIDHIVPLARGGRAYL